MVTCRRKFRIQANRSLETPYDTMKAKRQMVAPPIVPTQDSIYSKNEPWNPCYAMLANQRLASRRVSYRRRYKIQILANMSFGTHNTQQQQTDAEHRDAKIPDTDIKFGMKRRGAIRRASRTS
jgi:hypothetical protein